MNKKFVLLVLCIISFITGFGQAKTVTMATELQRLFETSKLPDYNEGSTVKQFSSYDRTGGNNDGFEGTYSFVRKNDDGTLVIFEAEGKGVIERMWTPTPTDDTLDFYFDGATSPSYSIKFNDLFSGKVYPFANPVCGKNVGGWYSYLPIPFSNGCKIVFRGKKILFHQIQYRQYLDDRQVVTFNPALTAEAKGYLDKAVAQWSSADQSVENHQVSGAEIIAKNVKIKPGQTLTLADIRTGGRIVALELEPAEMFEGLENNFDLRITWDGEKTPAVYAPVADFFGYAFGSKSMQSLLMGVQGNKVYSYIPMPFDRSGKVELIYRKNGSKQKELSIKSRVSWTKNKKMPAEGKFYSLWKREKPALGSPYVFLEGNGKGHYIGTLLLSQATSYEYFTEFFEGDDSTVLDGKYLIHGTGSEDYFNGGWYAQPGGWVERKGAPIHGCLDYSLPFSRTGGYRFYVSDKLPFSRSIYHSMEHGPVNNNRKVEYTSVAMYYSDKPIAIGTAPTNATSRIFIPDTLSFYSRLMNHLTYEGDAKLVDGNAELNRNNEGVILVDAGELSSGKYKVYMHGRGAKGISVAINEPSQKQPIESSATGERMNDVYLGEFQLNDPKKPVRLSIRTGDQKLQLNRIYFVKQ